MMSAELTGFGFLRRLVHDRTGVVIDADAGYLADMRLAPLARERGFASVAALLAWLPGSRDADSQRRAVEAMLTHETSFFRDPPLFDALRTQVIPTLTGSPRILSAACATGQEAYSVAILLHEHDPALAARTRIVAGDISSHALAVARTACYSQLDVNRGLPARLLARYFEPEGGQWRPVARLRAMIELVAMNVLEPLPASVGEIDLVLMRNVLIYLELPARRAALANIRRVLRPDGLLVLGSAETLQGVESDFVAQPLGRVTWYRPRRT